MHVNRALRTPPSNARQLSTSAIMQQRQRRPGCAAPRTRGTRAARCELTCTRWPGRAQGSACERSEAGADVGQGACRPGGRYTRPVSHQTIACASGEIARAGFVDLASGNGPGANGTRAGQLIRSTRPCGMAEALGTMHHARPRGHGRRGGKHTSSARHLRAAAAAAAAAAGQRERERERERPAVWAGRLSGPGPVGPV